MSTRLALRIQERFEKLTPSEQKLAALMLDRQDDLLTYSATELANFAGVSKATAARLFRSLGYSDFNEVRLQAREERNRTAPFERRSAKVTQVRGARSIEAHLQIEVANLTRSFESLRSDRLNEAADVLTEASRLWLLGLGLDEGLARYARLLFARLRPNVQLIGSQPGAWSEDLAMTGPGDALLVISVAPRPTIIRPILDYARTTRMAIVAVTDIGSSAWARRYARVVLPCHGAGDQAGTSHTVLMSMLRLLALASAERMGRASAQRSELIAEIHEELEDEE
ncbi:MurR/RpiR family transcriptional regulator [Labrys monachus]|uniref:DNA-binding MurR/RpiR family transcriptional regulator n=1 Tax=Labrys monachus TaxID=217067 RepID=A0ABU0FIH0_9HYPH|nr:MurR/RpiR family transcriptional regulator [Labrys monachus]MDQ0394405.1 DNA-binding MurR/RpiR family transcriptional regulator [Labrys monachus]